MMNIQAPERSLLEDSLRTVSECNEFEVNYQPGPDLRTGEILNLEALLRWNHPEHGLIEIPTTLCDAGAKVLCKRTTLKSTCHFKQLFWWIDIEAALGKQTILKAVS